MTKHVCIEYTIKPDVDLDEFKAAIVKFVDGIRAHHPEHRYTSFQLAADPCRFIHVGEMVEDVLPDLQRQPFFLHFTGYLRERCATGPGVTWLSPVASTAVRAGNDGSHLKSKEKNIAA